MNTEATGLSLTEWFVLIVLTIGFGGWAYFDNHVLRLKHFGDMDVLLFVSMCMPAFFFAIKWGEVWLRARSKHVLTNQGTFSVKRTDAEPGGESDAVPYKTSIALPALRWVHFGISKPTLSAITKVRYLGLPLKYMHEFYGNLISMADVARFDGQQHKELIITARDVLAKLPGVELDQDPILFGDTLETSWPRHQIPSGSRIMKKEYIIPSKPEANYDVEKERKLNAEHVSQLLILSKVNASVKKLDGPDIFGGR